MVFVCLSARCRFVGCGYAVYPIAKIIGIRFICKKYIVFFRVFP